MNKSPLLLVLPLLALPLAAARAHRADAVAFHPAEGLALKKTFAQHFSQTLEDLSVVVNGEDQEIPPLPDVSTTSDERIVVIDRYLAQGEGRPGKLAREFVELGGKKIDSQEDTDKETETSSEMEGAVVVFTWDEEDGEYALEIEDGDFDSDWLDALEEDVDLRGFLPDGEVAEGDTWEVGIEAFNRLLSPGGDLHIVGPDGRDDTEHDISLQIEDNMEGELEATYRGTRQEDGVTVAVIVVTGSTTSSADSSTENEMGEFARTVDVAMEVELELLWNVAAGHFSAVDLAAKVELTFREKQNVTYGEQEIEIEREITFGGELKIEGRGEAAE